MGTAEVREVFQIPKSRQYCRLLCNGWQNRTRAKRASAQRWRGDISKVKILRCDRFKDDVKEVQAGYECGIGIENFNDIKVGDTIDCYYLEEIKPRNQVDE